MEQLEGQHETCSLFKKIPTFSWKTHQAIFDAKLEREL
jgi:hypothetical protein